MSQDNHNDTLQCIQRCLFRYCVLLMMTALFFPISVKAYIGDYDGDISFTAISVKKGETYSFSCRGDDVERQRIEVGIYSDVTGKIDWTLTLNDTIEKRIIDINVRKVERNKYDIDHDESIVVKLSVDGKEMLRKDFGHRLPISKSPVFIRAQLDGKTITLSAGGKFLEQAGSINYEGFVDIATVSSDYDITLQRYYSLFVPAPSIPQIYPDEAAVNDAVAQCRDNRCGIWDFFDEEVETDIALKGGRYKVALLPSDSGGYDVIYLSGASVESSRWNAGALKGHLIPTPFADTFTLYWIDSAGKEISDMTPYATIEGAIMSFVFPIQKAKFRFVKVN